MTALNTRDSAVIQCAGGELRFDGEDRVSLTGIHGHRRTVVSPELALSLWVELWCGDTFIYFVGEKGRSVWYADVTVPVLRKTTELERLDFGGGYDPGGLHRVEFNKLGDDDLLLLYELGLARLTASGETLWQRVHDQLPARLDRVADGVIWLLGEYEPFGFAVSDGRPVVPES